MRPDWPKLARVAKETYSSFYKQCARSRNLFLNKLRERAHCSQESFLLESVYVSFL